ncbi:AAA family ATPase [Streptomyces sp. NBC_00306]|uniref:AAA family ATPase n=1 Tax=Streptomyces sp. NBC_00306 TaxID=2975708 RepID=UPI002E2E3E91|nr:AAA family ATPase [Streptomyces sp. NBC_00306]
MLYVVTGPPGAGKSSWIKAHAKASDIVIDLDLMALAMAGPGADHHDHSDVLTRVVHRARFAAMNEAFQHLDTTDVYLIHTMLTGKARAKYKRLNARIVVVDPGERAVRERVRAMRQPGMEAVVTRWYREQRQGGTQAITRQTSRDW